MPSAIEWYGSPNYKKGRNSRQILAIVDHITAGLFPGCVSWMQNRESQASAHYLVLKDGRILQLVKDGDTAWHAGEVHKPNWTLYDGTNPNRYTLGIEHESKGEGLTQVQYNSTLWLHRLLIGVYKIPLDNDHVIGHNRIDSVNRPNDPGPNFPWDRLFNDLKGEKPVMEQWKLDALKEAEELGLINKGVHNPEDVPDKAFVLAVTLNRCKNCEKYINAEIKNREVRQGISNIVSGLQCLGDKL